MPDTSATTNVSPNNRDLEEMRLQLDSLTESQLRFNVALEGGDRLGRQFGRTLTNAFVGLAVHGKSFDDVISGMALSLSKIAVGAAFKPLETAFGNAFQSLLSSPSPVSGGGISMPSALSSVASTFGGGGGLSSLFGGSQAASSSLVGSAANTSNIVFNVTTPNAESFYSSQTQIAALLARAVAQGQRNL